MISKKKLIRKYNILLEDVKTNDFYNIDLKNRVNCYKCSCGHITKTIDIHAGVTPFMHNCENCSNMSYSTFYNDIAPHLSPTQEWYRPTLEELLKVRKNEALVEHILMGGLDVRIIR